MAGRCRTALAPAKAARSGGLPRDPPARGPGAGAQQPAAMLSSWQPRAPRGWDGGTFGVTAP